MPIPTQYIRDVKAAGSNPLMTMVMLPWVAKSSGWSFSVAKYGSQCATDPYNGDAGDGVQTDCATDITGNNPNDANVPLLDQPSSGDPPGSVYRNQWTTALASAFGYCAALLQHGQRSGHLGQHPPRCSPEPHGLQRAARHLPGGSPQAEALGPACNPLGPGKLLLVVLLEWRQQQ